MNTIKIERNNNILKLTHPDCFNECNQEQFLLIIDKAFMNSTNITDRIDDQIILMQSLLKKPINKFWRTRWYWTVNDLVRNGMMDDILELQSFIFKDQVFNSWLVKVVKVDGESYFGPLDRFSYMKFGEFISADMLFLSYCENKDEATLSKFIAVLFRKIIRGKLHGDRRQEFDSESLNARSLVMAKLDEITRQAIVFNYMGIRHWLADKYKVVFNKNEESNPMHIEFGSGSASGSSWLNIRKNLSGDVFNLDKVDNLLLHDVLDDLNDKISKQ